jgi:hypothetical protein
LANGLQVDDNLVGGHTTNVSITNNSDADLTIALGPAPLYFGTAIVDGNTVQNLNITSTKSGDIFAGDGLFALMAEADNLQRFTVSSATASNMILGGVGTDACSTAPPIWSSCRSAPVSPARSSSGVSMPTTPLVPVAQGAATVTTILVNGATASTIVLGGIARARI